MYIHYVLIPYTHLQATARTQNRLLGCVLIEMRAVVQWWSVGLREALQNGTTCPFPCVRHPDSDIELFFAICQTRGF